MFCIKHGHPEEGQEIIGPFPTHDDAVEHAEMSCREEWEVIPMVSPDTPIETVNVVTIRGEGEITIEAFPKTSVKKAEEAFLGACAENIGGFASYTKEDKAAILDNGYEESVWVSLYLVHSE